MTPLIAAVLAVAAILSVALFDARRRLHAERQMHRTRMRAFVEGLREGVLRLGAGGEVAEANPAAVALLGLDPDQVPGGRPFGSQMTALREDGSRMPPEEHPVVRARREGRPQHDAVVGWVRPSSGDRVWLLVSAEPQPDGGLLCIVHDITAQQRLQEMVLQQTVRDPLTGCFNRRFLQVFAERTSGARWGCLRCDMLGLKEYNQHHGHAAGDELLLRFSRFLALQVRMGEAVVRLGGDSFVVLLVDVDDESIARVVGRIRNQAEKHSPASFVLRGAVRRGDEPLAELLQRTEGEPQVEVRVVERGPAPARRLAEARA